MKLATLAGNSPDGRLVIVSRDLTRAVAADPVAPTMQAAIERWDMVERDLRALADALEAGTAAGATAFDEAAALAPLPRAWQWLDGSAYPSHGELMQRAFDLPPIESDRPLMYQGMSDRFLAPRADVPLPSEADGIDFEGEYGVVTGAVPMGCTAADAPAYVRLIVQINDWSLRAIAPVEMKTGFGWVQAKPASAMAPVAVTPDELGADWADARVALPLETTLNGARFGCVPGADGMEFGFDALIAHAARTRSLVAGTVIGSGTVSSRDHAAVGSSCISERRAIEAIAHGTPRTPFLRFGDTVRMRVADRAGRSVFGTLEQTVVRAPQA